MLYEVTEQHRANWLKRLAILPSAEVQSWCDVVSRKAISGRSSVIVLVPDAKAKRQPNREWLITDMEGRALTPPCPSLRYAWKVAESLLCLLLPCLEKKGRDDHAEDQPSIDGCREDGWYWVRKKVGIGELGDWVPALWQTEDRAWQSAMFKGIPDSEMVVGSMIEVPALESSKVCHMPVITSDNWLKNR